MTTASRDDELANRVAALESKVADLRAELTEANTSSFILPPPPSPEGILRFTDQIAIPGIILFLETNIRMLKLIQRAIRISTADSSTDTASKISDDLSLYTTRTLEELENAINKLQTLEMTSGPADETAQSILQEIRSIKKEIGDEITRSTTDNETSPGTEYESNHEEIDEELQSIKDDLENLSNQRSSDETDE